MTFNFIKLPELDFDLKAETTESGRKYVTPNGAKQLIEQASIHARPTDVFIHLDTFPTINELFPWPVECVDDFTTIQNKNGCVAKHRYEPETYKIIGA